MKKYALLALVLFLIPASSSAQTLVVNLYDYADLSAEQVERIGDTLGLVFAHSGIKTIWRNCRGALPAASACPTGTHGTEMMVRILPRGPRSSDDGGVRNLASSFVTAEGGTWVTVFVPAVRAQAADFGLSFDLLLAYAVAHEVGHCLLGPHHSSAGLMKPAWNRKDAAQISQGYLNLTKSEARTAAARLSSAISPTEVEVQPGILALASEFENAHAVLPDR